MSQEIEHFGREYYRRYYHDPRTAVTTRAQVRALAGFIAACVRYLGVPVGRILDVGCGCGMLRAPLRRLLPGARYVGLEGSAYLCRRYGWIHGDISTFRCARRFPLVMCHDVLQYLDDRAAARAIANLARLCEGVLHFSALTGEDWRTNCDRRYTDPDVYLRTESWYRARLGRRFIEAGCGFWVRRGLGITLWELEKAAPPPDPKPAPAARRRKRAAGQPSSSTRIRS